MDFGSEWDGGPIGIPYNIARKVRNKFMFRTFCTESQIPAPRFHIAKGMDDLETVATHFQFPLVIKPAFGSSSAYVMKVENRKELMETYRFILSAISSSVESALTDGLDLFIEEYLDGDEVDIDVILQNGKVKFTSIADNYNKDKGTFFQDSGQAIPSSLPDKAQEELLELMEETLEKLGIQNGLIHFEGKYTHKGAFPIEINMRMGGDYVYSYNKSAWGVDLIEQAVHIALGEYIKLPPVDVPKKYIIGWDLHPDDSGMLAELKQVPPGFPFTTALRVQFEDGVLDHAGSFTGGPIPEERFVRSGAGRWEAVRVRGQDPYEEECRHFARAVQGTADPSVMSPITEREALRVALAARESLSTGRRVRLP